MSTQEERLARVESDLKQFKTETVRAYRDIVMEFAMVKGLTQTSVELLLAMRGQLDQRFDSIDWRFGLVEDRLGSMDRRFDGTDQRLTSIEGKLDQILLALAPKPE